jgi:prepilin-type N-terminal cleavage/methylation domain-containing protein
MPTLSVGKTSRVGQAIRLPCSQANGLRHLARGVTLMEMMVVMAIIGLITAISAPSITAGLDSIRMATASDSIAAFLNAAVNHAERRQQPVELIISQKDSRLTAFSNEPGFTREFALPDGILIEAILPQIPEDLEGVRRLILMPGATVPGIGIEFANRRGARRIVRLDPMTGFPHVERVDNK